MALRFPTSPTNGMAVRMDEEWGYVFYEDLGTPGSGAWRKVGAVIEDGGSEISPEDRQAIDDYLANLFWGYLPTDWFGVDHSPYPTQSLVEFWMVVPSSIVDADFSYLPLSEWSVDTTGYPSGSQTSNFYTSLPNETWEIWCGGGYSDFEVNAS